MKNKFFLLLLFYCYFSYAQNVDYESSTVIKMGQDLPNCEFKGANNNILNLQQYKGKVVLINFFATWCGPCMIEMPFLQNKIWLENKDNSKFALLSFGRDHSQDEINKFIDSKKFSFPIYADKGKFVYNVFASQYIPRNYLFDANGKLVYTSVGFSDEEFAVLKAKIKSLLK